MEKIASFTINHNLLKPGMYLSRVDGDVVTYDIRMTLPNAGVYLTNAQMHTFEHLFATFARNSDLSDSVIYVGPMGCRTGFYLLLRNQVSATQAIALVQNACDFIASYEGEIPGATEIECGNAAEHDLVLAKQLAVKMQGVLAGWTPEQMEYPS